MPEGAPRRRTVPGGLRHHPRTGEPHPEGAHPRHRKRRERLRHRGAARRVQPDAQGLPRNRPAHGLRTALRRGRTRRKGFMRLCERNCRDQDACISRFRACDNAVRSLPAVPLSGFQRRCGRVGTLSGRSARIVAEPPSSRNETYVASNSPEFKSARNPEGSNRQVLYLRCSAPPHRNRRTRDCGCPGRHEQRAESRHKTALQPTT